MIYSNINSVVSNNKKIGEAFIFSLRTALDYTVFTNVTKKGNDYYKSDFDKLLESLDAIDNVYVEYHGYGLNGTLYYKLVISYKVKFNVVETVLRYISDKCDEVKSQLSAQTLPLNY